MKRLIIIFPLLLLLLLSCGCNDPPYTIMIHSGLVKTVEYRQGSWCVNPMTIITFNDGFVFVERSIVSGLQIGKCFTICKNKFGSSRIMWCDK